MLIGNQVSRLETEVSTLSELSVRWTWVEDAGGNGHLLVGEAEEHQLTPVLRAASPCCAVTLLCSHSCVSSIP